MIVGDLGCVWYGGNCFLENNEFLTYFLDFGKQAIKINARTFIRNQTLKYPFSLSLLYFLNLVRGEPYLF